MALHKIGLLKLNFCKVNTLIFMPFYKHCNVLKINAISYLAYAKIYKLTL